MFKRFYHDLESYLKPKKVLIIYGPRRAGKTTLLEDYLGRSGYRYRLDSGDNIRLHEILGSRDFDRIKEYAEGYELIAIDEAQQIPNIGMALKIIVDQIPGIRVIATGSSSFDLSQSVGEPLTGRKRTLTLYPLAQTEMLDVYNRSELRERLADFLIFGQYPEVVTTKNRKDKIELLMELVDSYLLRDILALEQIKKSDTLLKLVRLLAFQIGQLVSIGELATQLHLDRKTIARYLDILEKGFVIYRLNGFSRNPRKEITKKSKYYFLDNGIRNAVINHFNGLEDRDDVGALWENFILTERMKRAEYERDFSRRYFWRTYDRQEIDCIEEVDHTLRAFEIKWSAKRAKPAPPAWQHAYRDASYEFIHPQNYMDFII